MISRICHSEGFLQIDRSADPLFRASVQEVAEDTIGSPIGYFPQLNQRDPDLPPTVRTTLEDRVHEAMLDAFAVRRIMGIFPGETTYVSGEGACGLLYREPNGDRCLLDWQSLDETVAIVGTLASVSAGSYYTTEPVTDPEKLQRLLLELEVAQLIDGDGITLPDELTPETSGLLVVLHEPRILVGDAFADIEEELLSAYIPLAQPTEFARVLQEAIVIR